MTHPSPIVEGSDAPTHGSLASHLGLDNYELEAAYQHALQLLNAGLNTKALLALEALVLLQPQSARYMRLLGFAYQRSHQLKKAYRTFARTCELDATDAIAALMKGECAMFTLGAATGLPILQNAMAQARATRDNHPYLMRAKRLLNLSSPGVIK